jgi:peptidoglycan/xylan/chitin deacetylase (PgdA/CDA1 family)
MSLTLFLPTPLMPTEQPETFEDRPAYRRVGIYLPVLFILGIAMATLSYVAAMQVLGWKTPTFGNSLFAGMPGRTEIATVPKNLILYASPSTKNYFATIGGNYDRLLSPWRGYFANRNESFQEISDPAQLRALEKGILILPSSVALTEEERSGILRFRAGGGAVLATWAVGTRNVGGDWEGWKFLEELGAKSLGEIPLEPVARHLILNGESPVSHSQGAGQRIWLGNASERMLRFTGQNNAARIMNWSRIPDTERKDEGAVIYAEPSATAGRTALFAFAESGWEAQPQPMYALVDDTLGWLLRTPVIVRGAWPAGKRAAQIIEMDTEEGFPNALRFASMMTAIDYRGTFYVLTSVGKQFPDVLATLARGFELGYHGDIHVGFKDQPVDLQRTRIVAMQTELASVVPDTSRIVGFRAPTEGYDANTEKLLQKSGIRHHVTDPSRTEARLPAFAKIDGANNDNTLMILPRTQRDDINLAKENLNVEQTTQALIADFDLAEDMGALGLLSVHSQNYGADSILTQAMPKFLDHLKSHRAQIWLASSGQVADWWRERERFKLSSKATGKRVEFNVTVTGNTPFTGGSLVVMLPQKGAMPSVQQLKIGMPKVTVQKIDDYRAFILFEPLSPGNYAYQATFE